MRLLPLAFKSARARAGTTVLTMLSIALSTFLLLGVEKIRHSARASFEQTVSGTDLIIGARSGPVNLLLYSVFRIGDPVANVSWESFEGFSSRDEVAWSVPLSLGDSHGPFRVLGTTKGYFEHYRYAGKQPLVLEAGRVFDAPLDAVLGADAARELGYGLGQSFHVSHGLGGTRFSEHGDRDFVVTGILAPTGTPVDQTIHVTLEGLDLVHAPADTGANAFAPLGGQKTAGPDADHSPSDERHHADDDEEGHDLDHDHDHDHADDHDHDHEHHDHADHDHANHDEARHDGSRHHDEHQNHDHHADEAAHQQAGHGAHEGHEDDHHDHAHEEDHHGADHDHEHVSHTEAVTAFLVGLKSPSMVLTFQRDVNTYDGEALTAVMPAVALSQLWRVVGSVEQTLRGIAFLVVVAGLLGMLTMLLTSLNERRREVAVLRAVGASSGDVFFLLVLESTLLAGLGALLGAMTVQLTVVLFADHIQSLVSIPVGDFALSTADIMIPLFVTLSGMIVGLVPGWQAYRRSLSDGLSVKL